jgi:hypothetical protein
MTVAMNLVTSSNDCQGTSFALALSRCECETGVFKTPSDAGGLGTIGHTGWVQPNEDSDGYTTTMPRFSAEDQVYWYGYDSAHDRAPTYTLASCGSGTLTRASTLLAGAAVAFGVASLAI